jgi:hypothetical protein
MKPGDTFDIRHETHHFIVRGYILDVDTDAGVGMLAYITTEIVDLREIDPVAYDWVDVQVARQQGGWAILRDDGQALKTGFATEAQANEWLTQKRAGILAGKVPS